MSTRAGQDRADRTDGSACITAFDRLLFFVLVAVLGARPLISESFHRLALSFLPTDAPLGPTPATTVWLDGILLVAAGLVLICRWRPRARIGVVGLGLGLLLLAVVMSVTAAHDKRLAANAGAHLFVLSLAAVALVRVMRARWMVRLLLAVVLAGGVTNAVKCVTQRAYEFDESLAYWQEQEAARAASGVDPNSPALVNYERRLRSREAFGYLAHPNVTASCLAMGLLVTAGLFVGVLRRPEVDWNRRAAAALVAGALGIVLVVGLWLTGSTGAMLAAVIAGGLLLVLVVARGWIAGHLRRAFMLLLIGYVSIIGVGAGYGLLKGTLPHTSLAFRWEYWRAAVRTLADAPWTGIGRENFRDAYLLHKSAESTEEVSNPHNLWLSLLVEVGPVGLLAGVLLIGAAVYAGLRGLRRTGISPPTPAGRGSVIAVVAGVLLVQAVFSGEQFGAPGILRLWAVLVAGVWTLAYLSAYSLISQADEDPEANRWLVVGVVAAFCAALIHNLIGFSLLTPAGLSLFVALAAAAWVVGARSEESAGATRWAGTVRVGTSVLLSVFLVVAYVHVVARPTVLGEAAFRSVPVAVQPRSNTAAVDSWDPELPRTLAQATFGLAMGGDTPEVERRNRLKVAEEYARLAWERNAHSFATARLRAEILAARVSLTDDDSGLLAAAKAWQTAVALYPTNPRARISAGRTWFALWKRSGDAEHAREAQEHFAAALAIDSPRLPEVAAKLRPAELQVTWRHLDELHAAGFGSQAEDTPSLPPVP